MASLIDIKSFHRLPNGQIVQSLADETTSGELVSSTEKLVQKFYILLMEQRGSVPYLPRQGTIFMNRFSNGNFVDDADVFVNFAAAMVDLGPQLRAENTVNDPPDERFVRAVVERVFITADEVDMQVRIDTQNGEGTTVLIPLRFQTR